MRLIGEYYFARFNSLGFELTKYCGLDLIRHRVFFILSSGITGGD